MSTKSWDRWQAPDRDSVIVLDDVVAEIGLGRQLELLLQMDGHKGTVDSEVAKVTGSELKRARRSHKIFERMGLLHQNGSGETQLTDLGRAVREFPAMTASLARRNLARLAIQVLVKYQLRNPVDSPAEGGYPETCTVHPYRVLLKAAVMLDGRLHWDEVNRALFWAMTDAQAMEAIDRIAACRKADGYDPTTCGDLGDRAYDQSDAPEGKTPDGQIRDQKITPWLRKAGFGGILLESPGKGGNGYWTIPADVTDIVASGVKDDVDFFDAPSRNAWTNYYGRLDEGLKSAHDLIGPGNPAKMRSGQEMLPAALSLALPKPFLLLAGISGTGKTKFVREQAAKFDKSGGNYCLIPVRPDWHEPADLLGYTSRISGERYVAPGFLRFVVKAWIDATDENGEQIALADMTPYWVCLDEMNLAPVEQYFADFLSVLETREIDDGGRYRCDPLVKAHEIASLPPRSQQKLWVDLGLKRLDFSEAGFRSFLETRLETPGAVSKYLAAFDRLVEYANANGVPFAPYSGSPTEEAKIAGQFHSGGVHERPEFADWASKGSGQSGDGAVSATAAKFVEYCEVAEAGSSLHPLAAVFLSSGIPIPPNLIVAGTVNMDETTHGFSRKVVDRAFTIDFQEFYPNDFDRYWGQGRHAGKHPVQPRTLSFPIAYDSRDDAVKPELSKTADPEGDRTVDFMTALNGCLKDTPFELAYRALNEALLSVASFAHPPSAEGQPAESQPDAGKSGEPADGDGGGAGDSEEKADEDTAVEAAVDASELALLATWDDYLMQKVLPRIEGDAAKLKALREIEVDPVELPQAEFGRDTVLHQLYSLLKAELQPIWGDEPEDTYEPTKAGKTRPDLLRQIDEPKAIPCRSRKKLRWMMRRLRANHFTDFWC